MMTVGVCVNHRVGRPIDEEFRKLYEHDYHYCQLLSWNPDLWTPEERDAILAAAEKYAITITGFWCGWQGPCVWNFYEGQKTLGLVPPEYREMRIKNLCDGADFAKSLGLTDVITHMGFIPENPYDPLYEGFIDAARQVAEHLKANGQYLLFESGQETPVAMLRAFEDIGTGNLGVNFDTGNVILYGKANPVDALDVIGKYVRNVHAKDGNYPTDGHNLGWEVKLGTGRARFPEFLRKLRGLGYNGPITIEREIEGDEQTKDINEARDLILSVLKEETEDA